MSDLDATVHQRIKREAHIQMNINNYTSQKTEWEFEDYLPAKSEGNQEILIAKDGRSALLLSPYNENAHESLLDVSWTMGFSDVVETGSIEPYMVEGGTTDIKDVNYFLLISPMETGYHND